MMIWPALDLFLGILAICLIFTSLFLKRRLDEKGGWLEKTKQELLQSETGFRSFFDNAPLPFAQLDVDTGKVQINRCFTLTFGYSDKDVPHIDAWWGVAYPDETYRKNVQERWNTAVLDSRLGGAFQRHEEFHVTCKNGDVKDVIFSANHFGRKVLITFFDISDLNHYQDELEKSLDRFQTLFDLLPFSCVINAMDGRFLLANKYFCRVIGRPLENIIGTTPDELGRKFDKETLKTIEKEIVEKGAVANIEATFSLNGETRHILYSSRVIEWEGEDVILSATVDITDKVKAKKALQKSEEQLSLAFEAANEGLWDLDLITKTTYCSPNYYKMRGFEPNAFPVSTDSWINTIHPDDRVFAQNKFNDYIDGRSDHYESEYRMQNKAGGWSWILSRGRIVERDAEHLPTRIVGTHVDITEKKETEAQLRQSQKMEAIGVLAGGIAHDFNNILSAMMGFTELARLEAGGNQKMKRYLGSISSAVSRAKDLVQHILTFSRKSDIKRAPIDLIPIIKESLKFIRASLPSQIDIRHDLNVKEAKVLGDITQIHQIMMNLFTNAGYAMKEDGGTLHVSLECIVINKNEAFQFKRIKPGTYFQLTVCDTGCGIPDPVKERIFEPFFTTKQRKEGTGMGLSTVYGILKEMSGAISVDSDIGVGTTFKVLIPEHVEHGNDAS